MTMRQGDRFAALGGRNVEPAISAIGLSIRPFWLPAPRLLPVAMKTDSTDIRIFLRRALTFDCWTVRATKENFR